MVPPNEKMPRSRRGHRRELHLLQQVERALASEHRGLSCGSAMRTFGVEVFMHSALRWVVVTWAALGPAEVEREVHGHLEWLESEERDEALRRGLAMSRDLVDALRLRDPSSPHIAAIEEAMETVRRRLPSWS